MRGVARVVAVAALLALAGAWPARAETTVEDVIQLAQKGLGEDVLLATVEQAGRGFALTADQVVRLKEANVSEKVIAAMLRKRAAPAPEAAAPVAPPAPLIIEARTPAATGTLNIENVDDRPWSCRLDNRARILWFSRPATGDQTVLPAHGGLSLSAPAGAYEARYVGENTATLFAVQAGEKSLLLLSRVDTAEFEGLYLSVFEKGERKAGGRLAILRQARSGPRSDATYEYNPNRQLAARPDDRVRERVVERVVYEEPARTVVYSPPVVYVPSYTCYPYYPYYWGTAGWGYPWRRPYCGSAGFGYWHGGRRSSWGVRVGVGF